MLRNSEKMDKHGVLEKIRKLEERQEYILPDNRLNRYESYRKNWNKQLQLAEAVRGYKKETNHRNELFISETKIDMLKENIADPKAEQAKPCITIMDHIEACPVKMQSRELLEHACEENTDRLR